MFKLIRNEYCKLLCRKTSRILILLLLLSAAGLAFFFHLPFVQTDTSYEDHRLLPGRRKTEGALPRSSSAMSARNLPGWSTSP